MLHFSSIRQKENCLLCSLSNHISTNTLFVAHCLYMFLISIANQKLELGMTKYCLTGVCPVLCSQRGEYINGECQCNPGWKGKECSLRHDECEVPDCNGHGHCVNGKCTCVLGYKGKFCEQGKNVILIVCYL